MREKYIEERIPRWYIFGVYPQSGNVDVSDGNGDVFTDVPRDFASQAIAYRDEFVDRMVDYWMERPEEFNVHSGKGVDPSKNG